MSPDHSFEQAGYIRSRQAREAEAMLEKIIDCFDDNPKGDQAGNIVGVHVTASGSLYHKNSKKRCKPCWSGTASSVRIALPDRHGIRAQAVQGSR